MVGMKNRKVGVGVGVSVGVLVGSGVAVSVGGAKIAVCVAAAPAVWTMAVNGALGLKVGMGGGVAPTAGRHASIKTTAIKINKIL